ncbi:MAG: GGDEF domain-containing protein, partial [Paraglaciecola sp.]
PIKELEDKAKTIDETAILVMLLGLGLALLITIPVSFILINPIENLSRVIKSIEKGETNVDLQWKLSKIIPKEIRDLKESFSNMMNTVETNKKEISKLAYYDANSGLPNRNYFYRLAHTAIKNMPKLNHKGALIFIDFDGFKTVNDTYGHRVGDELLFRFGQRLARHLSFNPEHINTVELLKTPPKVIPARLGGDEFVVLLQDIQHKTAVEELIKQLFKTMFSKYSLSEGLELTLTGSIGISLFPEHGHTYDELMKSADVAMYKAKSAGKNCMYFSEPTD